MGRRKVRRQPNVFDDLGFSSEDAAALHIKSRLHSKIVTCAKRYSQRQLAQMLGESQPRVSDLLRGKISKFSLETLITYAEALHMRPEIKIHEPVVTMAAARA
jgi:predicted XRE-type DNA-binding protein